MLRKFACFAVLAISGAALVVPNPTFARGGGIGGFRGGIARASQEDERLFEEIEAAAREEERPAGRSEPGRIARNSGRERLDAPPAHPYGKRAGLLPDGRPPFIERCRGARRQREERCQIGGRALPERRERQARLASVLQERVERPLPHPGQ